MARTKQTFRRFALPTNSAACNHHRLSSMPNNPSSPHDEEISETHNPTHGESQQILRKRKREGPHEEENGEEQDIVGPDDAEEEGGRG